MAARTPPARFTPAEFRYNGRVAAALVPSMAVAAALGGRAGMAVLTVGAMVWYLLDAMSLREGSLSVVSHGTHAARARRYSLPAPQRCGPALWGVPAPACARPQGAAPHPAARRRLAGWLEQRRSRAATGRVQAAARGLAQCARSAVAWRRQERAPRLAPAHSGPPAPAKPTPAGLGHPLPRQRGPRLQRAGHGLLPAAAADDHAAAADGRALRAGWHVAHAAVPVDPGDRPTAPARAPPGADFAPGATRPLYYTSTLSLSVAIGLRLSANPKPSKPTPSSQNPKLKATQPRPAPATRPQRAPNARRCSTPRWCSPSSGRS